ncbi:hypothetical protein ACJ72_02681 [Emergomyces africanus]|uniref:Myb-like domain-containing protein n=1 Tax=Emergomyces africanus TaxID=1955775 RepID=A0A1B7P1Q9_9EURO|nr:hypothetical protein ACJ72_02681 [Emergomyces africanus]
MPSYTDGRGGIKLSFADIFKSSRAIREEMAAASYQKATVAARRKKAGVELAARTVMAGGYPVGFRDGSPSSLPPGYPPLVYVPVPSKNSNQANGNLSPPQYQALPQTSAGQVQTNQPRTTSTSTSNSISISSDACTNNACASSSTNNSASTSTSQPQQQEWTTDDDDTLRRLKAEDMTWKAISTSMGRPVQALKTRWGIIRPAVEYKIQRPHTSAQGEAGSRSPQLQQAETHRRHERRVSFSEPLVMNGKLSILAFSGGLDGKDNP